jgi:hypothetical protein
VNEETDSNLAALRKSLQRHPIYLAGDDDLSDAAIVATAALVLDRIADDKETPK